MKWNFPRMILVSLPRTDLGVTLHSSMMQDDDSSGFKDLTNKDVLRILMQEIADVSRELKEDIAAVDGKLSRKLDQVHHTLSKTIETLSSDMQGLRLEVHQNQSILIRNVDGLDQRVMKLEAKAA